MHSHRLILQGGPPKAEWLLEWDDTSFVLKDPDGQTVFEAEAAYAHRLVELWELYVEGRIGFATPHGSLVFKKNRAALAELRDFVETRLGADADYRTELRRQALRMIPRGLAMFFVAGGLFGLYCWWAFTAGDPPPGTWLRWALVWFGWLIHGALLVLLAVALVGPFVTLFGLRQWLRLRRIERAAAGGQPPEDAGPSDGVDPPP